DWQSSEHKTGQICDDCSTVRTLQRRYAQDGTVYVCGKCTWCEETPCLPMGVTSLGLALHDEAAAFHDVLTNIPSDGEEMLEEGEIEPTTEESDIEIILEPMEDPDLSHRRSVLN